MSSIQTFANSLILAQLTKQSRINNEFFIQRLGGPEEIYSQNRASDKYGGHPALRARHGMFAVTTANADIWLNHMNLALDDVNIQGDIREAMWQFFKHVAYFLRNRKDPE